MSAEDRDGNSTDPITRQRSRRRMATENKTRMNVRVCIGEESSVVVGDILNVVSEREEDRRSVARRRTGRKKSTIGMNMRDAL